MEGYTNTRTQTYKHVSKRQDTWKACLGQRAYNNKSFSWRRGNEGDAEGKAGETQSGGLWSQIKNLPFKGSLIQAL